MIDERIAGLDPSESDHSGSSFVGKEHARIRGEVPEFVLRESSISSQHLTGVIAQLPP